MRGCRPINAEGMPEMTQQDRDQLFLMFVEIVDFARLQALLPQHLAWLTGKFEDGSLVVTGRLMEEDGSEGNHALVIVRAPSIEAAEELVADDPFCVAGVCRFTFRRFVPRMHTEAFSAIIPGTESTSVVPQYCRSP
jgi:uncharacterized protein YciI